MFSHNVNSINSSRLEGIGLPCGEAAAFADAITQGSGDVVFVLWGQSAGCYA